MNGRYIGTFVAPGCSPKDIIVTRRGVSVCDSFARRRGPLARAWSFARACALWNRVQRLGSRA